MKKIADTFSISYEWLRDGVGTMEDGEGTPQGDAEWIRQSTISEWKKNHTNPSSEKIMVICNVLGVTPEWLLSGTDTDGG